MPPVRIIVLLLGISAVVVKADQVQFKNGDRVSGVVTREGGKVTIQGTLFGTISADEKEILSVTISPNVTATTLAATAPAAVSPTVPTQPPAVKRWSGSVVASAIVARGNTHTEDYRAAFEATRKGDHNTLTLSAAYAFGQSRDPGTGDEAVTTDNWFTQAKLDHSLTERLYDYAIARVEQDNVANLDLRMSPGIGIGYRWVNKPETHFNTEAGVTWVWEQYDTQGTTEHLAVRLAYHLDHKLNDNVSVVHNVEYLPNVSDPGGDFNLNVDAGLRAMLTKSMFAEMKIEWKHDSTPAPDAEKNDLRYTLGLGWNF